MKKLLAVSVLATASAASMHAQAFKFDTPSDWDIRWDNTIKGNLMMRVEDMDPSVYDPDRTRSDGGPNRTAAGIADDADFSVKQGHFVSQRVDLLSEMDVIWKDKMGFRISGAGWYDFAYDGSAYPSNGINKAGNEPYSTFAYLTVQPGEYNDAAKDLHYRGGELLDAFVFANFDISENASANVRVGRHTIYWGQSLLATGAIHGFAGSMAALDLAKGLGTPGSEAKELFIPNNKISSTLQLSGGWSISAYYAMGFEPLRWPAAGTYFSLNELLTEHSECLTAAANIAGPNTRGCFRSIDYKSKDSGDWGINVGYYIEPWDLEVSAIYMNATDRLTSGLYSAGGVTPGMISEAADTNATLLGLYGWVYKEDIDVFGLSFSKQMWDISWGADFVVRLNNALSPDLTASLGASYVSAADVDTKGNYPGPTGDTAHIVINGLGFLDGEWGLWDGGTYLAELTLSQLLDFNDFENKANTYIKDDNLCSHIGGVFKPTWYQVRPGWDFSALGSVSYAISCKQAPNSAGGNEKVGNASIGGSIDIEQVWNIALNYNMYYGPQKNGTAAFIKDRDNIALTVKRTF
ncbi:Uncharacterised protein [Halioglobus japonicus]|nr:Uncharacterised protein [Halioglobus japonicus]CAA0125147.1 Uncharacterised protein [Halioglobus japonicus]